MKTENNEGHSTPSTRGPPANARVLYFLETHIMILRKVKDYGSTRFICQTEVRSFIIICTKNKFNHFFFPQETNPPYIMP